MVGNYTFSFIIDDDIWESPHEYGGTYKLSFFNVIVNQASTNVAVNVKDASYNETVIVNYAVGNIDAVIPYGGVTVTVYDENSESIYINNTARVENGCGSFRIENYKFAVGTYTVNVNYVGSNNFIGSNANCTFTVRKAESSFDSIDDIIVTYGNYTITVSGNVNGGNNYNGTVSIAIDGTPYAVDVEVDVDGSFTKDLTLNSDVYAGAHKVVVSGTDCLNYNAPDNISFNLIVEPAVAKFNAIGDVDATYGDGTVLITGTISDVSNADAYNGTVTVRIDGKDEYMNTAVVSNHMFSIDVPFDGELNAGNHIITVSGSECLNYKQMNNLTVNFTVKKATVSINSVNNITVKYGVNNTVNVAGRINSTRNGVNYTGEITVVIGDKSGVANAGVDGSFAVTVGDIGKFPVGEYIIEIEGAKTQNYNSISKFNNTKLTVNKADANITVQFNPTNGLFFVGDEIEIIVKTYEGTELIVMVNGNELTSGVNGVVGSSLNNVLKTVEYSYKFTPDKTGIYNVIVFAEENDKYNLQLVAELLLVTKKEAVLDIVPIADVKVGDKVNISVVNETNGVLTIKVNGKAINGEYEITKVGTYTVTAESAATEAYNKGFAAYTFEVTEPANITIVIDGVEYTIPDVNGTAVKTNLSDELENDKQNITDLTNQLEYARTNTNKLAENLDVANAKVGNLTSELADAKNNISDLSGKLIDAQDNASKLAGDLDAVNKTIGDLTGQLEESLANKTKFVVVNGVDYPIEYVNGTATVKTNVIEPVVKKDTFIEVDSAFTRVANDYYAGERGEFFYAVLKDSDGNILSNRNVSIAVNGPIYNVTTDSKGRAGLQVNFMIANIYTYALSFKGDDEYNAAQMASSKLTITKKSITISASSKSFKVKSKKTIAVTLNAAKNPYNGRIYLKSGKKVTLKVNGKKYTAKANAKGVAKFTINLTKKGKYTAKIKFAGDKTYKSASKSIKITIK